jgi:hypothetical protein
MAWSAFREPRPSFFTWLAHVSASLRDCDVTRAVDKLALMAQGIGGGRIGEPRHLQLGTPPGHQLSHRRDDRLRQLRHRRAERLGEDAPPAPPLPAHHLAQSADRLARLQRARNAGGAPYVDLFRPPTIWRALRRSSPISRGSDAMDRATHILERSRP